METNPRIIGRAREQNILRAVLDSPEAQLISVYGRRRIGKTFLIKEFFRERFDFYFTGSFELPAKVQLALFARELSRQSGRDITAPVSWFEAFDLLRDYLASLRKKRLVVFLDELPWMDTPKSRFLSAFSFFWNSWGSTQSGLKLIVCGSATSWMLEKIIGDKGGLYGRSARSIRLEPFALNEAEQFLAAKKIAWTRHQILEACMILGGTPYYLDMLDPAMPFSANIDALFFGSNAPLRTEFDFLFRSLFKASSLYRRVVESLAKKRSGLTLAEIKASLGLGATGTISTVLSNLEKCDFIRRYSAFGRQTRNSIYQLTDLYCLFHQTFLGDRTGLDEHYWSHLPESRHNAWAGYAFEQVCLRHIPQIKRKLGISGVLTNACAWSSPRQTDKDGTEWPGAQIDLILERNDQVINLCEMKYSRKPFVITRDYDARLRERAATFAHLTGTRSALHTTFITSCGIAQNAYSGNIRGNVTAEDLFRGTDD